MCFKVIYAVKLVWGILRDAYFALAAAVLMCIGHSVDGKPLSCPKLSKAEYADMNRKLVDDGSALHWSFYLLPIKQYYEHTQEKFDLKNTNSKYIYLYGKSGKHCPKTTPSAFDIHDDCPVHFVLQHDSSRVPNNLVHARCNCERCRASKSKSCTPVYTYTRVFRRNERCQFETVLEAIPVACTCTAEVRKVNVR